MPRASWHLRREPGLDPIVSSIKGSSKGRRMASVSLNGEARSSRSLGALQCQARGVVPLPLDGFAEL